MALECLYHVDTGFKLERLMELSKLVEKISKIALPRNKPIVGTNTFIHEADIHVTAILSGHSNTFEPYKPELVGQTRQIYFGSTTSTAPSAASEAADGTGSDPATLAGSSSRAGAGGRAHVPSRPISIVCTS